MKRLILPIMIIFSFVIGLNAGVHVNLYGYTETAFLNADAEPDALITLDEIKANIQLTDSQANSIDSILKEAGTKLQGVTDQGDTGNQAKAQIVNDAYSAVRNVLSDDQKPKFDALVAMKKSPSGEGKD